MLKSGVDTIEDIGVLNIGMFREFGSPLEIIKNRFGNKQNYIKIVKEIEEMIYEVI